jgi:hypothetical protein
VDRRGLDSKKHPSRIPRGTPRIVGIFHCPSLSSEVRTGGEKRNCFLGIVLAEPLVIMRVLMSLLNDRRGSTFTEYLVAVGVFGIAVGAMLTTKAQVLIVDYANARDLVFLPAL